MKNSPSALVATFLLLGLVHPMNRAEAEPDHASTPAATREHIPLDQGWKFHLGNDWSGALHLNKGGANSGPAAEKFDDVLWRSVNLPHDWAVELPFDEKSDKNHGFKPVGPGFPQNNTGWYRREFDIPSSDQGKRIWLQFDGIYRDARVFVNGWEMIHHESGYSPFRIDITDIVHYGGKNTVAAHVDVSNNEGWFYEGAGIYRHVWLDKTAPVAIATDGVFVTSQFEGKGLTVPKGLATLTAAVTVSNTRTNAVTASVAGSVTPATGGDSIPLVSKKGVIAAGESRTFTLTGSVSKPKLWSPESPTLYRLSNTVSVDSKVIDRVGTTFGIRSIAFDKDQGFLLNGKPYPLYGTCNHQDHAGVGAALPDAVQDFRIQKLREFSNAYRTSHNPPTPELLDACDRQGMIVMDENRLLGSSEQNLDLLRTLILRDRNHPSVCIWSLCNEESRQTQEEAGRIGLTMQRLVKQLDPTRPVTAAEDKGNVGTGLMPALEVRGWNYQDTNSIDSYREKHPEQPHVGTEQASYMTTRGEYVTDAEKGFVDSYVGRGNTPEHWWGGIFSKRPWLSGGFVWTGFDYRGEPTPYGWPCVNSHFGVIDTCGFPKDNWWYYRAWWTKEPVLHLSPHWNWPGKEGQEIRVDALANCHEVELFLNGTSLGKQEVNPETRMTWQVKYAPGTLSAKGYDAAGKVVSETKVETTGAPAALQLEAWKPTLDANPGGSDVVNVSVVDDKGRVVPTAMNEISFSVSGPAKILGVGNGNPSCHESDQFFGTNSVSSVTVTGWKGKEMELPPKPDRRKPYSPALKELLAKQDDTAWPAYAGDDKSLIPLGKSGVCTTVITLSPEDLKSEIFFSQEGFQGAHLFVNGYPVEDHLIIGNQPAPYGDKLPDTKSSVYHLPAALLHAGENKIQIVVETGATHPRTSLELLGAMSHPQWTRSLFNGYAQVILGSTGESGDVILTASGKGLKPASVTLKAESTAAGH
jgi:beta-galactosidase